MGENKSFLSKAVYVFLFYNKYFIIVKEKLTRFPSDKIYKKVELKILTIIFEIIAAINILSTHAIYSKGSGLTTHFSSFCPCSFLSQE